MASRNVYSPDYDAQGNPKPSIPELKDAIENARLEAEGYAQQSRAARDDAFAARDDALAARDSSASARDEALEAANDLSLLGGVDGTAEEKTGASTLERADGTTVDASNHSGEIWYVVGETRYYESNGTDWVQTGPDFSDAGRLTKGTLPVSRLESHVSRYASINVDTGSVDDVDKHGVVRAEWWATQGDGTPSSPFEDTSTGTAGIQPAIDYLKSKNTGGRLLLPRGICRTTQRLEITEYPVLMQGHGTSGTWNDYDQKLGSTIAFRPSSGLSNPDCIRIYSDGPEKEPKGTRLRDFKIHGDDDGNSNSHSGVMMDAQDSSGKYSTSFEKAVRDVVLENLEITKMGRDGVTGLGTTFHISLGTCWLDRNARDGVRTTGIHGQGPPSQWRLYGQGFLVGNGNMGANIGSNDLYIKDYGSTGNPTGCRVRAINGVIENFHSEGDKNVSIRFDEAANDAQLYLKGCNVKEADTALEIDNNSTVVVQRSLIDGNIESVKFGTNRDVLVKKRGSRFIGGYTYENSGWAQIVTERGLLYAEDTNTLTAGGTLRIGLDHDRVSRSPVDFIWRIASKSQTTVEVETKRARRYDGNRVLDELVLSEATGNEDVDIEWEAYLDQEVASTAFRVVRIN